MAAFLQQSSTMLGNLKKALLGNPVTRDFNVGDQVASFGPSLLWKVFDGKKKSTGQEVSIFIFEKSSLDKYDKNERDNIIEKMKHGPQQLTKLRHPRILTIQHPLEDSRDSIAFATEPVFCCLSNVLGKFDNLPSPLPKGLKDFELYSVEKVYGLLQIAEGLAFVHNDANIIEGNLTCDNIIITKGGQWKLAGFHFSLPKRTQLTNEYTTCVPIIARPDLNYLAPEFLLRQPNDEFLDLSATDMFSFGCLISALYNNLKTPFDTGDNIAMYKKCLEQLNRLGRDQLHNIPLNVRDHCILLLSPASHLRPDAASTITHQFFDDVSAMTLKYMDSLVQRNDMTKSQFFKNLHHVLDKLPLRVLHQRILPPLFLELANHMMIPFILPNIFIVAEKSTNEQYMNIIFPELKKVFPVTKPVQVLLLFMQNMELLLKMTDKEDVKSYVLPLVFRALESLETQIQELVLNIIPEFVHLIDYSSLKNSIVPRIKTLVTRSTSLSVCVNALVCLGKVLPNFDKFLLIDEIFPMLSQVPFKDPAVLMAILGIYKQTISDKKINLEKDYLATIAIPFLLPLSVEPSLNVLQFNNYMSVIREMFDRVEQEHRTKLEQLNKMQEEQRLSLSFVKSSDKDVQNATSNTEMLISGNSATSNKNNGNAELEMILGLNQSSFAQVECLKTQPNTDSVMSSKTLGGPIKQSQTMSTDYSINCLSEINISQINLQKKSDTVMFSQQPLAYSSSNVNMAPSIDFNNFRSRPEIPLISAQQNYNQPNYNQASSMCSQPNGSMNFTPLIQSQNNSFKNVTSNLNQSFTSQYQPQQRTFNDSIKTNNFGNIGSYVQNFPNCNIVRPQNNVGVNAASTLFLSNNALQPPSSVENNGKFNLSAKDINDLLL
ncbi:SCY1-like protein 2 isoform X3 [Hydra vulgaris]|uniref:SCY1-like protein 2 isoform X3 n=1 Tax=Hydra vulgaris TaxID=6087 RepID=A0ABM4BDA3_HYDVU